jgi:hypothetical protein
VKCPGLTVARPSIASGCWSRARDRSISRRTQWLPYLVGMERPELLACIEEPVAEPDPRQEQQAESVEAAMWAVIKGLGQFS